MFGLSDASQVNKFGSLGPNGNEDSGLYEYSKGMGADGQKITIDDSEMIFSVKVELESTDERFQDPSSKFISLIRDRPRKIPSPNWEYNFSFNNRTILRMKLT